MSESLGQYLIFDMFVSFPRRLPGVKDAVNIMLDASTAWSLPVALHFSVSAPNTGIGRSAGQTHGRGSCSSHSVRLWSELACYDEESQRWMMVAPLYDLVVNKYMEHSVDWRGVTPRESHIGRFIHGQHEMVCN